MRQALSNLRLSLGRIRGLANGVAASAGAALSSATIRGIHETQLCGAVVLSTGYFESFLKEVVRAYLEGLSRLGLAFSALPESIRNVHYEGGGAALTKASALARRSGRVPYNGATREDIASRLNSAANPGTSYAIVWEAFADTRSNPGPDVVKEIARSLGLQNVWPTISAKSGAPSQWSETALVEQLANLITRRNACAHTGTVSPPPTASDILDIADLLDAIGEGFVAALEAELVKQVPPQLPAPSGPTTAPSATP